MSNPICEPKTNLSAGQDDAHATPPDALGNDCTKNAGGHAFPQVTMHQPTASDIALQAPLRVDLPGTSSTPLRLPSNESSIAVRPTTESGVDPGGSIELPQPTIAHDNISLLSQSQTASGSLVQSAKEEPLKKEETGHAE